MTQPVIGFAGLSHLGLVSGICAASKGFPLVGFDARPGLAHNLQRGELPISEPDLNRLLKENRDPITFTSDPQILNTCDVVYFALDIQTDEKNQSDVSGLQQLISEVVPHVKRGATLVVLSQVHPGFTRQLAQEMAETLSQRQISLYYQVETLIFGCAVERALRPERYIVGSLNPKQPLPARYEEFLKAHDCPILQMRYESAELAKISINMCLVASVGVANTMAEVCEQVGADWSEIVPALKLDRRIGPYSYLAPGLGLAGGNLERDLATVIALSKQHGTDAGIVSAWVANSRHRKEWTWRTLNTLVLSQNADAKIAVLGLAYKEDTHSTKNSPSLALLSHLKEHAVVVYDPVVSPSAAGLSFKSAASALEATQDADVVCIMTPWGEFKKLLPADLAKRMRGRCLIDPYKVLDGKATQAAGLRHVTLGVAPEES